MKAAVLMPWGRVGSNLVMEYLRGCTRGSFANESLNGVPDSEQQISWLTDFFNCKEPFICCKQSTLAIKNNSRVSEFFHSTGVRVVRMFRKNLFKATLSQIRAEQYAEKTKIETGKPMWAVTTEAKPLGATIIEPSVFLQRLKIFDEQTAVLSDTYASNVHCDIYYEELNSDIDKTMSRISNFLGLPTISFVPSHQKATPDNPLAVIENVDALAAALEGAGYEFDHLVNA